MPTPDTTKLRIRVAELCGWKRISKPPSDPRSLWPDDAIWEMIKGMMIPPDGKLLRDCGEAGMQAAKLPDYCKDLNAIHEAERAAFPDSAGARLLNNWAYNLYIECRANAKDNDVALARATAEQRCRAFVATMEASSVPNGNEVR